MGAVGNCFHCGLFLATVCLFSFPIPLAPHYGFSFIMHYFAFESPFTSDGFVFPPFFSVVFSTSAYSGMGGSMGVRNKCGDWMQKRKVLTDGKLPLHFRLSLARSLQHKLFFQARFGF
jgi:hypothetical protein